MKVNNVEEQKLGSKIDLKKVNVKHVKQGLASNIQIELVDHIYNQRFQ